MTKKQLKLLNLAKTQNIAIT